MGEQEEDMDNIRVVLASASPRREELLRQIGIIPEVIPSEIEEKVTEKEPDRVVTELSRQKADEVAARLGETDAQTTVVVGSDTVVYANGEILGKPADEVLRLGTDTVCSRAVCNIIINAHRERIGLLKYHAHTLTQKVHVHISVNIFPVKLYLSCDGTAFHKVIHTV